MIKFENLLSETKTILDIEELESAADLFQMGLESGTYKLFESKIFNETYWGSKNRILANEMYVKNPNFNYMVLLGIIKDCKSKLKENQKDLEYYVYEIIRGFKGKCA